MNLKINKIEINWVTNKVTKLKKVLYMTHMQRTKVNLKICWETIFLNS
jgi:hypothetical protein